MENLGTVAVDPTRAACLDSDEILDTQWARRPRPALRNRVVQLALGVAAIAGLLYWHPSSWPWFMLLAAGAAFLVLVTPRLVRAYTARRLEAIETGLIAMKDAKMPAHAALLHARALLERETVLLQRGQRLSSTVTLVGALCAFAGIADAFFVSGALFAWGYFAGLLLCGLVSLAEQGARAGGIDVIAERSEELTQLSSIATWLGKRVEAAAPALEPGVEERDEGDDELPAEHGHRAVR